MEKKQDKDKLEESLENALGYNEDFRVEIDFNFKEHKGNVPVPKKVPELLQLSPIEFMEAPLEHFQNICLQEGYVKVTSALTFLHTLAGEPEEIVEHVKDLKTRLKKWHKEK